MKQSSMQTFLSFSGYERCVSNKTGELVQNEPMKLVYSLVYSTDLPGRVLFAQPLLVSDHSMDRAAVVAAPLPGTHPGHSYDPKRAVYVLPESLSKASL